jgi:hypothetical protein
MNQRLRCTENFWARNALSNFSDDMPEELSVDLCVPPICGASDVFWTDVEQRVGGHEAAQREAPRRSSEDAGCLRSSCSRRDGSPERHKTSRERHLPWCSTISSRHQPALCLRGRQAASAHTARARDLATAYRCAFLRWRAGETCKFPVGTWAILNLVHHQR